ncbi:yrrM [Symbiodinium natans]|uniref:YrrM protein n=1 Tax=Symbiodinium natans TaxID=878477 RepID=A0A812P075_9DINO|nr:yrrM [Symbiodinium natans]
MAMGCERECLLVQLSQQPLLFVCQDFLSRRSSSDIIHAAKSFGKAAPVFGEDVKYEMPLWPEEQQGLDQHLREELELVYRRLDLLCGTPRRRDEHPPRVHFQAPRRGAPRPRMPSGLHLDTNGAPHRFVTALVYLDTLPQPEGDGATVFPCASGEPPEVQVSKRAREAGEVLWREGGLHTKNLADPELEIHAEELMDGAQARKGLSVYPECGKLALFFSTGDEGDVDPMSWHGGAQVGAAGDHGGKWMLQIFKTIPPELRGRKELISRFCQRCRQPPDFTLDGVYHRQVGARPGGDGDSAYPCAEKEAR